MRRASLSIMALVAVLLVPDISLAFQDDEACLMCHKYPMLGRVTDDGAHRSYNVVPAIFSRTVHRNVPCRDCHTEIRELPHKPVVEGVRCDSECHSVTNPSTNRPFSHKPIYNVYRESAHGREKIEKGPNRDKPYCVACHTNPLYNPKEEAPPQHITNRCNVCHEDRKFVEKWYNHTGRRIKEVKRDSREISAMCASCHGDKDFIGRRQKVAESEGRKLGARFAVAVESYKNSFHGRMSNLGRNASANCFDCHIDVSKYFMSVHAIYPSQDARSPVSSERRAETCRRCHEAADANYAAIDPHPTKRADVNPFNHYADMIYEIVGTSAFVLLLGMMALETFGRWRDGASWGFRNGTSWLRRPRRRDGR